MSYTFKEHCTRYSQMIEKRIINKRTCFDTYLGYSSINARCPIVLNKYIEIYIKRIN